MPAGDDVMRIDLVYRNGSRIDHAIEPLLLDPQWFEVGYHK